MPAIATSRPSERMPRKLPSVWVRARNGPGLVSSASANISPASASVSTVTGGLPEAGSSGPAQTIWTSDGALAHDERRRQRERLALEVGGGEVENPTGRNQRGQFGPGIASAARERADWIDVVGIAFRERTALCEMGVRGGEGGPDRIVERMRCHGVEAVPRAGDPRRRA